MNTLSKLLASVVILAPIAACATTAEARPNKTKWVTCWDNSQVRYGTACPDLPVLEVTDIDVNEDAGTALVTVKRSGLATTASSFEWSTQDETAIAPDDYAAQTARYAVFGIGGRVVQFTVPINDDGQVEGMESLSIVFTPKQNLAVPNAKLVIRILDNDVAPIPEPTPEPTPVTEEMDPRPGVGLKLVPSNFDLSTTIRTAGIPSLNSSDVVGAFRFICGAGQVSYDDPIVYPGQPGKSHLHQYYGNTSANAYSTYPLLRTHGGSTCNIVGDAGPNGVAANRSAYWMPAMFDGKGNVILPEKVQVYYKREPDASPKCDPNSSQRVGICIGIPNGIQFIAGFDMAAGKPGQQVGLFKCVDATDHPVVGSNDQPNMVGLKDKCVVGGYVEMTMHSGRCWNGQVKADDHRSHLVKMVRGADTDWVNKCPSTHPYYIPQFTISSFYKIKDGDDLDLWSLSSDHMYMDLPKGSTAHFDYFEAWDGDVKAMWVEQGCVGQFLNCSAGNLGDGHILEGADAGTIVRRALTMPDRIPIDSIPRVQ